MPRMCELTGIQPLGGNRVSHSNRKTHMRQNPNLQSKRYHLEELSQTVTLTLSTRAIRTIDKQGGLSRALLKAKEDLLSQKLRRIRRRLKKSL